MPQTTKTEIWESLDESGYCTYIQRESWIKRESRYLRTEGFNHHRIQRQDHR